MANESIRLNCNISRGAFSGERVFEIRLASGEYTGVAPLHYFQKIDGGELMASEPPPNNTMAGTLSAKLITMQRGEIAFVAIPDGEAVTVPASNVVYVS